MTALALGEPQPLLSVPVSTPEAALLFSLSLLRRRFWAIVDPLSICKQGLRSRPTLLKVSSKEPQFPIADLALGKKGIL